MLFCAGSMLTMAIICMLIRIVKGSSTLVLHSPNHAIVVSSLWIFECTCVFAFAGLTLQSISTGDLFFKEVAL